MNPVLVYVGDDPDFVAELKATAIAKTKATTKWSVLVLANGPGLYAQIAATADVVAVVLDFSIRPEVLTEHECMQMVAFKRQKRGRTIPLVGLFLDKEQLDSSRHLYTLGIVFGHIKGSDTSLFLRDLIWLAVGSQDHLGSFATSKRLDLSYNVQALAACVELRTSEIKIDSDIMPPEGFKPSFAPFGGLNPHALSLLNFYPHACWHDAFYSMRLRIDYPGPWDDPDASILAEDTLLTWISQQDRHVPENRALVFTQDGEMIRHMLSTTTISNFKIAFGEEPDSLKSQLLVFRPHIFCLQLPADAEINDYMCLLKSALEEDPDWKPYVMVYESTSSSEEWRQAIGYDRIIASAVKPELVVIEHLLEKFNQKNPQVHDEGVVRFPLNDVSRLVEFGLNVFITSLSEHEITFFCEQEIPMYTNLKLAAPVDMYILIVPQFRQLSRGPKGTHYQGIIHCLDQESEETLRQYVNAIIFDPPKVFGVMPATPLPEACPLPETAAKEFREAAGAEAPVQDAPILRRVVVGKSKL